MKKKDTDLWLVKNRASGKVKVTTRCVVVPPSPTHSEPDDDQTEFNVDDNNNNNAAISPTTLQSEFFNAQQDSCTSPCTESSSYTRNRSTTRSWPVIYRNNSLPSQQNFLDPSHAASKTEQLLHKSELKRKSTHQYDFDQIFGLNNANYQQYLATARKQSSCDFGYDKSPSIYDMQHANQENPVQTQNNGFCSAPPTVIFLLLTLLMTTTATSMLCAAIMTGDDNSFLSFVFFTKENLRRSLGKCHLGQGSAHENCQPIWILESHKSTWVSSRRKSRSIAIQGWVLRELIPLVESRLECFINKKVLNGDGAGMRRAQ